MLILVLKDSLRTFFKSLSLSWSLGVRSLSLSLGGRVQEVLVLVLVLGGQVLVLVLVLGGQVLVLVLQSLWVRSLLTSLVNVLDPFILPPKENSIRLGLMLFPESCIGSCN